MALNLPPIAPFRSGINPSETWTTWRRDFLIYLKALKYHQEDEDIQVALFLQVCGTELSQIYHTLTLSTSEEVTINQVLKAFDDHFAPFKNLTMASFLFHRISQQPGQAFDQFLTLLRLQAQECEFGSALDRILKDRIIQGIRDQPLQERLLRDGTISLQKVIEQCKAAEASRLHASAMSTAADTSPSSAVDHVSASRRQTTYNRSSFTPQNKQMAQGMRETGTNQSTTKECSRCGTIHYKRNCPANGTRCSNCNMQNHWARVCRQPKRQVQRGMHVLTENTEDDDSDQPVFLAELTVNHLSSNSLEWLQSVLVNGTIVNFKLDTGAQVNILPKEIYCKIQGNPQVRPTKLSVSTYTGEKLPIVGETILKCSVHNKNQNIPFLITTVKAKPILGLQACQELNLVLRIPIFDVNKNVHQVRKELSSVDISDDPETILAEYSDLFEGQGKLPGKYSIVLQEGAQPHVASPRRVPLALEARVKEELMQMERDGIIVKVEEPTDWVNNMVVVQKPNRIRICLDPRPLNKVIKRNHYPLPTPEALFTKLKGSKVFSLFDAKQGFWHLELDEPSSYLTTFITSYGRYRYRVLPYGLSCAPEAFQMAMDNLFATEPDINPYIDDILLESVTKQEHCIVLRRMLKISRKAGLRFNRKKLQLAVKEVRYLGHVLTECGIAADPEKLAAIAEYPSPKDKRELLRFLGLCTYLLKFVPGFSQQTYYLRTLLKKYSAWIWDSNTQNEFDNLKYLLSSPPVLQYFDNDKPVIVSVDASSYGLGCVLLQNNQPVMYASASLTPTEQTYSQIEKELLAAVYAVERFHYYVYGRPIELHTDHKPLLGLSVKPYHLLTPRLQRLMLRLQRYNVIFTYVPGKQLVIADTLSRAPILQNTPEDLHFKVPASVCLIAQATPVKIQQIKNETTVDSCLQAVIQHIVSGWPENKKSVHHLALPFWPMRDELHFTDGLLCRGNRLVIPQSLRKDVLETLHESHRGIVSCKNKAREALYWPGMAKQIEEFIATCTLCQRYQALPQKEPMLDIEIPARPWEQLAMDFFYHQQNTYLIVIDYFSKFVEVIEMTTTTATSVIKVLKSLFARFGLPSIIISDNGSPFQSAELTTFFVNRNIEHKTSSPLYPRANGLVERSVRTIKTTLKKTLQSGGDIFQVLLDYRSTPIGKLPSPSEMLMGRRIRSQIPILPKLLDPKYHHVNIAQELRKRQEKQHVHGDKGTKPLNPVQKGDKIWYWNGSVWEPARVISDEGNPRSYQLETENGLILRRNRLHIRPRKTMDRYVKTPEDYYDFGESTVEEPVPRPNPATELPQLQQFAQTRSGRQIKPPVRYPN